jgi:hypothetical protein
MTGETEMHDLLGRADLTIREDVRALATQFGDNIWIEKIIGDTSPVPANPAARAGEADEMVMLFDAGLEDPALKAALGAELTEFANKIPDALFNNSEPLKAIRAKAFDEILYRAAKALGTRTVGEAGL